MPYLHIYICLVNSALVSCCSLSQDSHTSASRQSRAHVLYPDSASSLCISSLLFSGVCSAFVSPGAQTSSTCTASLPPLQGPTGPPCQCRLLAKAGTPRVRRQGCGLANLKSWSPRLVLSACRYSYSQSFDSRDKNLFGQR